jgi:cytochrome c biogenesis protein CcmG/thiol:disulfide interchange protein DsbE
MVESSTTCFGGWPLAESEVGPLPRPSLKLTGVFLGVVAIGLVLGWILKSPGDTEVARLGAPAPDFTVELIAGGTFNLAAQLKREDKPVLVNLWASWCIPCRTETPDISEFALAHPEIMVIGVAVEDTENGARAFAAEFDPAYDLAFGTPEFEESYPRFGLPTTYVIGENGELEQQFNGIVTIEVLEQLISG